MRSWRRPSCPAIQPAPAAIPCRPRGQESRSTCTPRAHPGRETGASSNGPAARAARLRESSPPSSASRCVHGLRWLAPSASGNRSIRGLPRVRWTAGGARERDQEPDCRATDRPRLRNDGGTLVAKVKHDSTHQPRAWWLVGETRVTTEQRVDGAGRCLPSSVRTTGVPYRTQGPPIRLALRCPLEAGALVRCEAAIAQGTIGQAWWSPPIGKSRPSAVYAARQVAATDALRVEPVHTAPRGPSELRDLPLMVAQ